MGKEGKKELMQKGLSFSQKLVYVRKVQKKIVLFLILKRGGDESPETSM